MAQLIGQPRLNVNHGDHLDVVRGANAREALRVCLRITVVLSPT